MTRQIVGALVVASILTGGIVYAVGPRTYQTANLNSAPGDPPPGRPTAGAATLYRSKNALEMRVASGDLAMDHSYTVWWVIFNNPAACVGGCGADDLPNPAVGAAVFYAAGFVTGMGTSGNVSATIDAGRLPEGIDIETGTGLEPGNGFRAEVHIVIRTHGPTIAGIVDQQIGSFNGGCPPPPNTFPCRNVRVAVFLPVDPHP
jgi:hypothetical protein